MGNMLPKKILVINKYFFPSVGGGEVYIREVFGRLLKNGWLAEVHTARNTYSQKNVLPAFEEINSLPVFRHRYRAGSFSVPVKKGRYDVVCLNNFNLLPHAYILARALLGRLFGRKDYSLLLIPHGGFTPAWDAFPPPQRLIKRAFHRLLGSFLINAAVNRVIAVSEFERLSIINQGVKPELITVIGTGVESEAFNNVDILASADARRLAGSLGRYIVQLGRIDPVKNIETSVRALTLLPPDVNLLIIGQAADVSYENSLRQLVADLGLETRVVFTGLREGYDKYFLLRRASALSHLSLSEANPIVVLEAFSQGVPCVVSDHPALAEHVKEGVNGYLVPARDVRKAAGALRRVLDEFDTPAGQAMLAANRERAAKKTWDAVAKEVHRLLLGLVSQPVGAGKASQFVDLTGRPAPRLSITVGIPTCYSGPSLVTVAESIMRGTRRPDRLLVQADRNRPSPEVAGRLAELGVSLAWNSESGSQFKKVKQLLDACDSDIFVFTEDDVSFSPNALEELSQAFERDPELTMVSARVVPLPPENFVEASLAAMVRMIDDIGSRWKGGNNFMLANGRCLAFRTSHFKRFRMPENIVTGDMFLYLENGRLGGKFLPVRTALVSIRCPRRLADQIGPSSRFQYAERELPMYFSQDITAQYRFPKLTALKSLFREFVRHPFAVAGYCGIFAYTRLFRQPAKKVADPVWEVDVSTKQLDKRVRGQI